MVMADQRRFHFEHRPGDPLILHSGGYRSLMASAEEWGGELNTWSL
jgi:hypothetical protein